MGPAIQIFFGYARPKCEINVRDRKCDVKEGLPTHEKFADVFERNSSKTFGENVGDLGSGSNLNNFDVTKLYMFPEPMPTNCNVFGMCS